MGGEHPVLGVSVHRRHPESGAGGPGVADAAESRLLPARLHVHDVLRVHHLPELSRKEHGRPASE